LFIHYGKSGFFALKEVDSSSGLRPISMTGFKFPATYVIGIRLNIFPSAIIPFSASQKLKWFIVTYRKAFVTTSFICGILKRKVLSTIVGKCIQRDDDKKVFNALSLSEITTNSVHRVFVSLFTYTRHTRSRRLSKILRVCFRYTLYVSFRKFMIEINLVLGWIATSRQHWCCDSSNFFKCILYETHTECAQDKLWNINARWLHPVERDSMLFPLYMERS
jgi:hypothetical protein